MAAHHTLLQAALALPEGARADLAMQLVASLDSAPDEDAEAAWAAEVGERVADLRAGRAEVMPFADAIAEARAQLRAVRG